MSPTAGLIDSHCHLTHERFSADRAQVLERAYSAGLDRCVTIGTGVEDAGRALELSRERPELVSCTAGIDPFSAHRAAGAFQGELDRLAELVGGGGFCAVGEIGLDYHYDLDPRPRQRECLERQLQLASELDLPVVIHVRDAHDDMIDVLGEHPRVQGVIHSFTAGPREAERYLDLGWCLAFNGVLTFKNAEAVRQAARACPEDRLLVETDAPYLAPVPHRGRRCEPGHVVHTVETLARLRGRSLDETVRATTDNARRLFRL
jgi:TatD DNase family protein